MKKIIFVLLIFTTVSFALFSFGKKENKPAENMYFSEAGQEAEETLSELTGLVEPGFENRISILENPTSRSRVSYYTDPETEKKLEKYLGQTITVTGIISKTENPFIKNIKIIEILK